MNINKQGLVKRPFIGLLSLTVAALVIVVAYYIITNSVQLSVVKRIQNQGGFVDFKYYGPNWFLEHAGPWYPFKSVMGVELGAACNDADLREVAFLKQARDVTLSQTKVKGPGLLLLKHMPHLRMLDLTQSSITDAGLLDLRYLTHLKRLILNLTMVSDTGLANLEYNTNLQSLLLQYTGVTDKGMAPLERLKKLKVLNLNYTRVGNKGMKDLQSLTNLQELDLDGTGVTDAGLHYLGDLPLQVLHITKPFVTKKGIAYLKGKNPGILILVDPIIHNKPKP